MKKVGIIIIIVGILFTAFYFSYYKDVKSEAGYYKKEYYTKAVELVKFKFKDASLEKFAKYNKNRVLYEDGEVVAFIYIIDSDKAIYKEKLKYNVFFNKGNINNYEVISLNK